MLSAAQILAQNNFGNTRSGGLAGPMGLFILILLGVATVLLIRNMNARLRRLPDRFPDQPGVAGPTETLSSEESNPGARTGIHQPERPSVGT